MGSKKNLYLEKHLPVLFRRSLMDQAIYVFIDAQKFTIPSISIEESAKAFMVHNKIEEEEYSLDAIKQSYLRTRKAIYGEEATNKKAS